MHTTTDPHPAHSARCGFCGCDISDMPGWQFCGSGCQEGDRASRLDELDETAAVRR